MIIRAFFTEPKIIALVHKLHPSYKNPLSRLKVKCLLVFWQMATLTEVHQRELDLLLALRASNESKLLSSENCCTLGVCVCQKAPSGAMVQCELCRDVFHSGCITVTSEAEYGQAWLCPYCQRSKKPPLDKVLPLLASLQRIRVRLPEGDALRFLIERTVRWQHRVQQACTDGVLQKVSKTVRQRTIACLILQTLWLTERLFLQGRVPLHLTQEINSLLFHKKHCSIPIQGQSWNICITTSFPFFISLSELPFFSSQVLVLSWRSWWWRDSSCRSPCLKQNSSINTCCTN